MLGELFPCGHESMRGGACQETVGGDFAGHNKERATKQQELNKRLPIVRPFSSEEPTFLTVRTR